MGDASCKQSGSATDKEEHDEEQTPQISPLTTHRLRCRATPGMPARRVADYGLQGTLEQAAEGEAVDDVTTVMVTVCCPPVTAIVEGENVAVAPVGRPVAAKLTVPA